jgi:hypothetical protein
MYKQLKIDVEVENWLILGYYTYRSARIMNVIVQLPYILVEPLLNTFTFEQDNHIIYHILDTKRGKEWFLSVSDKKCKLGMHVVEESW